MIRKYSKIKHKQVKLVIICTILTMVSYAFFGIINNCEVKATQIRQGYAENNITSYPGYKDLIENLRKEHPNWKFTIFYTGLDWNQVIKNESSAYHGRNVVPASSPSSWKCSVCGETPHGGSSWRCASEAAVSYYMDPRNWVNNAGIFQFENLAYNESTQTVEGVQKIISGIKYMQGNNITYTNTSGAKVTLNKSYAQVIMEAAKEAKISPYHLASRIRQEQGAGSTPGSTATGTYSGYVGYYNFMNIKASGSNNAQVIANGLTYARNSGWTNPEISIKEGAKILAKNYINDGQDTLYLQKFDVDNSDGTLYYFQYMQNVSACVSEGASVKKAYEEIGMINTSIEFIIPVYENMPQSICPAPQDANIITQNIKVKGDKVAVREGPGTTFSQIATLNTGDTLLRIETAIAKVGDYYWDKVVLSNGRKGYMARNFIVEIADITNCNDMVVANTSVNLRNGPGVNGTTVITTLIKDQVMTRIETGKYNVDGYIWDRVKLSDGRQGYIAQNYINKSGSSTPGTTVTTDIIKVVCSSGLKVREKPGTNEKVLTYVNKNDILTRTQAGASNANGYTWDKVVTSSGIEGYIARGDSKEQYIEVVSTNTGSNTTTNSNEKTKAGNSDYKLEKNNLICTPGTTIESIKEKNQNKTITVKKPDGSEANSGNLGTGYVITIDGSKYTVIKIGDPSGDGKISAIDLLQIKKHLLETDKLTDIYLKSADINNDGKISAIDLLLVKKHLLQTDMIEINY